MSVRIVPVVDAPWDDVRAVFGTRGDPARCWCQYFKLDAAAWKQQDVAGFERALCAQVDDARETHGAGPGLLAYADDEPVGWVAIEPQPAYARIVGGDDPATWTVSCFVVRIGHRRQGVARALLDGAVAYAKSHGARTIEAHPVDAEAGVTSAELFHGPLSAFEAAGFAVIDRPSNRRARVRLEL